MIVCVNKVSANNIQPFLLAFFKICITIKLLST